MFRAFKSGKLQNVFKTLSFRAKDDAVSKEASYMISRTKQLQSNPMRLMAELEADWNAGKAMTEDTLQLYFAAASKANVLSKPNLSVLATRHAASQANLARTALPSHNLLAESHLAGNSLVSGSFVGSSIARPLYIRSADPPRRVLYNAMSTYLPMLLMMVLALSIVNDSNKSSMSGTSGNGNGNRAGMGSTVKQAELDGENLRTFADVVGVDEAKEDLEEIVRYLRDPEHFTRLGGKLPKGVLLSGPPGTGKTLLAKAVAGEAGVPFFHAAGSEFDEMYVGVGAKRMRELFAAAREKGPSIVFLDEIDAVGGKRSTKDSSSAKMTLNQLLVEMDGFKENEGVIVIAATNLPESLDSALTRPGRFDKQVSVSLPDLGGRKDILLHYGKKIPLAEDVDVDQLARGTPGFSGAELFNVMNLAAVKASLEGANAVTMKALEYAKDKVMMGAERKSAKFSEDTRRTTAFHEAGHALVALATPGCNPVHKATIMPRGRALGMVMQLQDGDQTSMTLQQMSGYLDLCLAGRVAEELLLGKDDTTSGATQDFKQATSMARAMVAQYGLSERVGLMVMEGGGATASDAQKRLIDVEVRALLNDSYQRVTKLLHERRDALERIAQGLLNFEYLSGSELVVLMEGGVIDPLARSEAASRPVPIPKTFASGGVRPTPVPVPPPVEAPPSPPKPTAPLPVPVPVATSATSKPEASSAAVVQPEDHAPPTVA